MRDISKYQGILPAFYACYDAAGDISPAAVQALTSHLIAKGVRGVYVGGSSGECIYQTLEERKLVLENVMKASNGALTVIAHVACNNTHDSQLLARHAEQMGVDAIAAIPPIYFHLPDHAIADYWNDICSAAPNTDFVIYNVPQLAGVTLTMPLLREMLKNPNVVAVKNSSMSVQDIQKFLYEGSRDGREFIVFNGADEQLISGLVMGAAGGIGGTYGVMPELYIKLFDLFRQGELKKARSLQFDVDEIVYELCSGRGHMYAVIKEVLRRREGLDLGGVRPPLPGVDAKDEEVITRSVALIDAAIKKWR
ncbi:MAG: dihydrodipicolinate synthase family protein [Lachnospiraceae bacterium]|nr:dihydrodipicolinate synthase family protein [Lachnospiraceae bacterium]